jgi:hypothetical protein
MLFDERPYRFSLIAKHQHRVRDACGFGAAQRTKQKRLTQKRMKELGAVLRICESVAITGGQDDGIHIGSLLSRQASVSNIK